MDQWIRERWEIGGWTRVDDQESDDSPIGRMHVSNNTRCGWSRVNKDADGIVRERSWDQEMGDDK